MAAQFNLKTIIAAATLPAMLAKRKIQVSFSVSIWHSSHCRIYQKPQLDFCSLVTSLRHPLSALLTAVAVGLVVATGGVTVGSISGGAFNPAVVFGSAIMGIYAWETIWIFLLANIAGSVAAAIIVFKLNWAAISYSKDYKESSIKNMDVHGSMSEVDSDETSKKNQLKPIKNRKTMRFFRTTS